MEDRRDDHDTGPCDSSVGESNTPPDVQPMTAYFPGVPDETLAAPVTLRPGAEVAGVDFRLSRKLTFRVSGQVVGPQQVQTTTVRISPRNTTLESPIFTGMMNLAPADANGNFTLDDVSPGSYRIQAQTTGVGGQRFAARMTLDVTTDDVENVTLLLRAGIRIAGSFFLEGATVDNAAETAGLDLARARARLFEDNSTTAMSQPSDANGGFELEDVFPGTYRLDVTPPAPDLYVKRILIGSEEVAPMAPSVEVTPDFDGRIDILLSPNGGRVGGTVTNRDGDAVPGAAVTLVPGRAGPDEETLPQTLVKRALTGPDGTYSLTGIAPGEYQLFAWEATQGVPYLSLEFLRGFDARAERLTIREGDDRMVALDLIPAEETQ